MQRLKSFIPNVTSLRKQKKVLVELGCVIHEHAVLKQVRDSVHKVYLVKINLIRLEAWGNETIC